MIETLTPLELATFEEIHADQRPHPIKEPYSLEELIALGTDESIDAVARRAEEIQLALNNPFEHGWFFESWDGVCWELLRHRMANMGLPIDFLLAGSNGAAKTHFVARCYTLAMEQCTPDQPDHQREFWTFSDDDDKSAAVVEKAIRFWQPNDYKTETGRLKKLAMQKMGYDAAGGFTNNECLIPTGAVCLFKTRAQDVTKLEGGRPVTAWSDERTPAIFLQAVKKRLLTAAETTWEMLTQWKELIAHKERDPSLKFPHHLIGRLLVGVHLVTYTFRDGFTDTVRYFIEGGTVMGEIEADRELLPLRTATGEVIGGERLSCLVHGKDPTSRAVWIYAWGNPLGGNWAGMKRSLLGKPRKEILWQAYGIAEGTADSPFPNFNVQVHVRPVPSKVWLPPPEIGTWWMSQDPNASGGRAWFQLWAFVLGESWHFMQPGDILIAHEYPQTNDVVVVPGAAMFTGEDCEWAKPGGKNGLGIDGNAQKVWPCGYEFRASEIRRIEAKLARWQGITDMRGQVEKSMLDIYGRRISDSRSTNTKTENQEEAKTIIEWMNDNDLYFSKAGGTQATNDVLEGEQNINNMLMWDRELCTLDTVTGWKEVDPQKGRGPKIRIAEHCTNLIGALSSYPGFSVDGAGKSAWKDPIDALRILLNANPEYVNPRDLEPERGGYY